VKLEGLFLIECDSGTKKILSAKGLHKAYGSLVAVNGVSFDVGHGEIVGLLGPNGAGKTTIVNMVLGVLQPDMGTVVIGGLDFAMHRSKAAARTNFAAVYAPLPGNLTVSQNLEVFGRLYGVQDLRKRVEELLKLFDLEEIRNKRCGVLSSGEQTRSCLAKALLNRPELLLLDEPTASLDPAVADHIRTKVREFVAGGRSGVLWTSHNMVEVAEVCDRVFFLSHGKVLLEGDPRTLPARHGKRTLEELFIAVAREPLTFGDR